MTLESSLPNTIVLRKILVDLHLEGSALMTAAKLIKSGARVQRMDAMHWYFQQQLPNTITHTGELRDYLRSLALPAGHVFYQPDGGMRFCYVPEKSEINIVAFFRTHKDPQKFFYGHIPQNHALTMRVK